MEPTELGETVVTGSASVHTRRRKILLTGLFLLLLALCTLFLFGKQETVLQAPTVRLDEVDYTPIVLEESAHSLGLAKLSLDSAISPVNNGETFVVTATIDPNSNNVNGAELEVVFDPQRLKLEKVEPSQFFSLQLESVKIDNDNGVARFAYGVPLGDEPIDRPVSLAVLTFIASAIDGLTTITVGDNSLVAAVGMVTNALGSTTPAVVEVVNGQ